MFIAAPPVRTPFRRSFLNSGAKWTLGLGRSIPTRLFPSFPAARKAGEGRQNSLSCALCCAALSLRIIPINESAGREKPQDKGSADDRHLAELPSTCGVY